MVLDRIKFLKSGKKKKIKTTELQILAKPHLLSCFLVFEGVEKASDSVCN